MEQQGDASGRAGHEAAEGLEGLEGLDRGRVLRDLPVFCAIAEAGQVTLAAAELGQPQSMVSRTVGRLEAALGVRLFERRGRGMELTEAGRHLLPYAQAGLQQLDAGLREVRGQQVIGRDTLRVAVQSLLGLRVVPPLIARFRASYPEVGFELVQGSRRRGLTLLEEGRIDMALLSSPPRMPRTTTIEMAAEPLVALVPAGHPLHRSAPVAVEELADEELIMLSPDFDVHGLVHAMFASVGRTPRIGMTTEDYYTVRGLVSARLGVSIMPPMPTVSDGVRELRIDSPMARRTIGAVVHEDAGRPALTAFVRMLAASDAPL